MGGRTRTSGQGRPAGTPNRLTKTVREAFERAFYILQQGTTAKERSAALEVWALRNPTEFYKLAARLIPTEINATINETLSETLIRARKRVGQSAPPPADNSDLA